MAVKKTTARAEAADNKATKKKAPPAKAGTMLDLYFRYIKLLNGEDILCQVPAGIETDTLMIVRYPIKIVTINGPTSESMIYSLQPWIPFTSQDLVAINKISVVSITTIKDTVKEIYLQRVTDYLKTRESEELAEMEFEDAVEEQPEEDEDEKDKKPDTKKDWLN